MDGEGERDGERDGEREGERDRVRERWKERERERWREREREVQKNWSLLPAGVTDTSRMCFWEDVIGREGMGV